MRNSCVACCMYLLKSNLTNVEINIFVKCRVRGVKSNTSRMVIIRSEEI